MSSGTSREESGDKPTRGATGGLDRNTSARSRRVSSRAALANQLSVLR